MTIFTFYFTTDYFYVPRVNALVCFYNVLSLLGAFWGQHFKGRISLDSYNNQEVDTIIKPISQLRKVKG